MNKIKGKFAFNMWVDFDQLHQDARIWVFTIDNDDTENILSQILTDIKSFILDWTSHSKVLEASAMVCYDRYLVISLDESKTGASGCSIDKLMRFIQKLEVDYGISLLLKSKIGILQDDTMKLEDIHTIKNLVATHVLNDHSLYADTTISSKGALSTDFLKPLGEGWISKKIFN